MKTLMICLAVLFLIALATCSQLLPDYEAQVAEQQAAIEAAEQEQAALTGEIVALQGQLETAPPEVVPEIEATIEALRDLRAQAKAEEEVKEEALKDFKTESAGKATGAGMNALLALITALGLGGTAIGAKVIAVAGQVKNGPSRAQGEIDELWEKTTALKADLERRLALLEAGLVAPPTPAKV